MGILLPIRLKTYTAVVSAVRRLVGQLQQDDTARIHLFIGYDTDDPVLSADGGVAASSSSSSSLRSLCCHRSDLRQIIWDDFQVPVTYIALRPTRPFATCYAWNECALAAYREDCDYFLLLGDDVEVISRSWYQQVIEGFLRIQRHHTPRVRSPTISSSTSSSSASTPPAAAAAGVGTGQRQRDAEGGGGNCNLPPPPPYGAGCVAILERSAPGWPCFPVVHRWHIDTFGALFPTTSGEAPGSTWRPHQLQGQGQHQHQQTFGFYNQDADPFLWELYRRVGLATWTTSYHLWNRMGGVRGGIWSFFGCTLPSAGERETDNPSMPPPPPPEGISCCDIHLDTSSSSSSSSSFDSTGGEGMTMKPPPPGCPQQQQRHHHHHHHHHQAAAQPAGNAV